MAIDYAALVLGAVEQLGTGGGGVVQFLKDGDTTIKLVPVNESGKFFQSYTAVYKGEPQQAVLVSCVILASDADGVADKTRVRYLKLPPTAVRWLIKQMQSGWELLETKSETVTISRAKGKYANSVVKRTFDATGIELPEQTIEDAAAEQEKREMDKVSLDVGEAF